VTVGSGDTAVPARRRRRRANRRGSGGRHERATLVLAPDAAELRKPSPADLDDDAIHAGRVLPVFAHASEGEMARILDFYRIRWEYEPHTFPILWTLDGDVAESFSPDFWLPDLDLYLEMTTLRQKLVRKKNRKLRRIRELYPDLRIKLFYARDFRALMLKFGRLAMVDALSGTSGQVVPDRSGAGGAVAAIDVAVDAEDAAEDGPEVLG
jgi:hypoxanthine phosphoribosyltransferase